MAEECQLRYMVGHLVTCPIIDLAENHQRMLKLVDETLTIKIFT